jgi:hypothetical protein
VFSLGKDNGAMSDEPKSTATRRVPLFSIANLIVMVVIQVVCFYVVAPPPLSSTWWLLVFCMGAPLLIMATIAWNLLWRRESRPAPVLTAGQRRWNAVFFTLGILLVIGGVLFNLIWAVMTGCLLAGGPNLLRSRDGKFQFSLGRLFYLTTVFAIAISVMVLIQRQLEAQRLQSQMRADFFNYQARKEGVRRSREQLELWHGRVSPQLYQQQLAEICLFPFWRRTQVLHRQLIRHDGNHSGTRDHRSALPLQPGSEPNSVFDAGDVVKAAGRDSGELGAPLAWFRVASCGFVDPFFCSEKNDLRINTTFGRLLHLPPLPKMS